MGKLFINPLKIDISEILNPTPVDYRLKWAHEVKLQYAQKYAKLKMMAKEDTELDRAFKARKDALEEHKELTSELLEIMDEIQKGTRSNNDETKQYIKTLERQIRYQENINKEKEKEYQIAKEKDKIDREMQARQKNFSKEYERQFDIASKVNGTFKEFYKELDKGNSILQNSKKLSEEMKDMAQEALDYNKKFTNNLLKQFGIRKEISETEDHILKLSAMKAKLDAKKDANEIASLNLAIKRLGVQNKIEKTIEGFKKSYEYMTKKLEKLADVWNDIKNVVSAVKKGVELMLSPITSFNEMLGGIPGKVLKLAINPLALLSTMVITAIARIKKFDDAAVEMSRQTGATGQQLKEMNKDAVSLYENYKDMGVTIEEMPGLFNAVNEGLGNMSYRTAKNTEMVLQMSKGWGVSTDAAAEFVGQMRKMTGEGDKGAQKMMNMAKAMADAKGVPVAKVIQDVANASDEAYGFMSGMPDKMIATAAEARRLGMNLDSVSKMARGLLNVQESIGAEMEASIMTGKNLNFNLARQKALEGDLIGAQEEVMNQLGGIEEFNKMDILQKEAIAKATGLSVKELSKTLEQRKEEERLAKERENREKKMNEAIDKGLNMFEKITKISDRWSAFFERIGKILAEFIMPYVEKVMKYLEKNFGRMEETVKKFLDKVFKPLFLFFKELAEKIFGKFNKELTKGADIFDTISGVIDTIHTVLIENIIPGFDKLYNNFISPILDYIIKIVKETLVWLNDGGWAKLETTFWAIVNAGKSLLTTILKIFGIEDDGGTIGIGKALDKILGLVTSIAGFIERNPELSLGTYLGLRLGVVQDMLGGIGKFFLQWAAQAIWSKLAPNTTQLGLMKQMNEQLTIANQKTTSTGQDKTALKDRAQQIIKMKEQDPTLTTSKANEILKQKESVAPSKSPDAGSQMKKTAKSTKFFDSKVIQGAAAMLVVAGALWVLAKAVQEFMKVDWESMAKTGVALGGLLLGLLALVAISKLIKGAQGDVLIGALVLMALAGALWIVSEAAKNFAEAAQMMIPVFQTFFTSVGELIKVIGDEFRKTLGSFADVLERLSKLDAMNMIAVASGIAAIGGAILAFGVGTGYGGMIKGVGEGLNNLLGGTTVIQDLKSLSEIGPGLATSAAAILAMKNALDAWKEVADVSGKIEEMAKAFKNFEDISDELVKSATSVAMLVAAINGITGDMPARIDSVGEAFKKIIPVLQEVTKAIKEFNSEQQKSSILGTIGNVAGTVVSGIQSVGKSISNFFGGNDFVINDGIIGGNTPLTGNNKIGGVSIQAADKDQILATTDMKGMIKAIGDEARLDMYKLLSEKNEELKNFLTTLEEERKKTNISNIRENEEFLQKLMGKEAKPYLKIISDVLSKYFDDDMNKFKMDQLAALQSAPVSNNATGGVINASLGMAIARENAAIGANVGGAKGAMTEIWQSNLGRQFVANSKESIIVANPNQMASPSFKSGMANAGIPGFSNGGTMNAASGTVLNAANGAKFSKSSNVSNYALGIYSAPSPNYSIGGIYPNAFYFGGLVNVNSPVNDAIIVENSANGTTITPTSPGDVISKAGGAVDQYGAEIERARAASDAELHRLLKEIASAIKSKTSIPVAI